MTKYNSSVTIKAISSIIAIDGMSDQDKLDIIKRIIEIVNTESCDKDGWYLWDAAKEKVSQGFVPEHIRGKKIQVRFRDGEESISTSFAESWDFSNLYCSANIAAYRIVE